MNVGYMYGKSCLGYFDRLVRVKSGFVIDEGKQ